MSEPQYDMEDVHRYYDVREFRAVRRQRDELLAALKEARSLIRSQISDAALDEGYWPTLKPRITALDAAIAKAEGK